MMKLLEKYYNINYYCAYKLLFFLCWRMLNPLYWLSLLKWDNRYIKWLVSIGKKIEEGGMVLPCLPCLPQDFQDKPIKYFEKRHHFLFMARSFLYMRILCQ